MKHLFKMKVSAAYGLAHAESEYLTNVAYPSKYSVWERDTIGDETDDVDGDVVEDITPLIDANW